MLSICRQVVLRTVQLKWVSTESFPCQAKCTAPPPLWLKNPANWVSGSGSGYVPSVLAPGDNSRLRELPKVLGPGFKVYSNGWISGYGIVHIWASFTLA